MSSIRIIQTERLLKDIVRLLYSSGEQPTFGDITTRISRYASLYPLGLPLPMNMFDIETGRVSNVEMYNKLLQHLAVNIDVLYEACLRQVDEILVTTSSLHDHLESLFKKRRRIETKINDYLLSQRNTDGYFHSISDNFSDIDFTDIRLTTAQVDTESGVVVLPTISSSTKSLPIEEVASSETVVTIDGAKTEYRELAPFTGALEQSLDNFMWAFEVETREPREVIATTNVSLGVSDPVVISRIDIRPYGATPVQVFIQTRADNTWLDFGNKIQTSTSKMIFGDSAREVSDLRIVFRKTDYDYTVSHNNELRYRYIFGARELAFIYQLYERNARFVSTPLFMPAEYDEDLVIDAVSIDVKDNVPQDTDLKFFVAATDTTETEISDFIWREIIPVTSRDPGQKIVRFNGANHQTLMIRENPFAGDMQLIPFTDEGPVQDRNPTPSIIDGVDIYRIAEMENQPLLNSVKMIEGLNTTKIYSRDSWLSVAFSNIDLEYWGGVFDSDASSELDVTYGRIDAGNEFFFGGDVGAPGKDVFVEAFLETDHERETFLDEFQKVDVRSRTWDVKVFLNGRPLGHLPVGTHRMRLPWNFKLGMNHIVVLIRIPNEPNAHMGAINPFGIGIPLYRYGTVMLAKWRYVDMFTMKYNEHGQPRTFTIHNNEIVSRRKPTTNFQLQYATSTGVGPIAVRFRAELSRSRNNPNVSPTLESYRVRFSYSENE